MGKCMHTIDGSRALNVRLSPKIAIPPSTTGGVARFAARTSQQSPQPPITAAGVLAYSGVLSAIEITVSGRVPEASGSPAGSTTYFVVDKAKNAIVGNITLPNAPTFAHTFRLSVRVASLSGEFDVGLFDDSGTFVPAGFTVEVPTGAVGPRG